MWQIVLVAQVGSATYKYPKTGSGSYSLSDAIYQALHKTNLKNVTSVTATII
jgi:hypothetical protein